MAGEINDGDLIIVNDKMNDLANDGTYVVSIDDKLYVKLLQRILKQSSGSKQKSRILTFHCRP